MSSPVLRRGIPYPNGAAPRQRPKRRQRNTRRGPAASARGVRHPNWLSALYLLLVATLLWAVINGLYQVVRKPSELLFPVSGTLKKSPADAWRHYGAAFRQEATPALSAQLLAALAQTESTANPIARPEWRWSWSLNPLHVYRPASTAVGMYQMTDGNFQQARRLCIREHAVRHDCWTNMFYSRLFPGDAIEMTSAYLDATVDEIVTGHARHASPAQKEMLAALVHLCGPAFGERYARTGFTLPAGQRCGAENPRAYLARVMSYRHVFAELSAAD